ncbi:MAG: alanine racemase [Clostridia bacterium]|nr:alanine racemase [Clostridia bacterium]
MLNKIIIYKDNLINNIKQVKFQNPNSKVCAMVKANAYGVGVGEVVQVLDEFVDFWGVACFFEAQELENLTNKKILIVGALEKENVNERFSYTCSSFEDVQMLASTKKRIKIHLKINTGMNRYGFKDVKDFKKALSLISKSSLELEGIFTHFATHDDFVDEQMKIFKTFVKLCYRFGFKPIVHADNSSVNQLNNHHLDMVRIGFNLYNKDGDWFLPVREIKSKIVQVQYVKKGELVGYNYRFVAKKNLRVAIIPLGYADGFDMRLIGMKLLIDGKKCEVLNICMDCFMLDISSTQLKKGDEIYILNKFNSLSDYAKYINVSEYEMSCKFSHMRADRVLN